MHELNLIHTDLKPENVLLVTSDYVKVPDYKVWISAGIPCAALIIYTSFTACS